MFSSPRPGELDEGRDPDPANSPLTQRVEINVEPKTGFTTGANNLQLIGLSGNDDVTSATIEVRVLDAQGVDTGQTCARLHVMALPPRIVSLGIYRVEDPTSSGTQGVGGPSERQIVNTLNKIFDQAGIEFQLDGTSPAPLQIEYDDYAMDLTPVHDGRLQEEEADTIVSQTGGRLGKRKLFLVKKSGVQFNPPPNEDQVSLNERIYVRGYTPFERTTSFIFVDTIGSDNVVAARNATHELGHALNLSKTYPPPQNHDLGPFPSLTRPDGGLMKPGGGTDQPGQWLSHLDWKAANDAARTLHPD